MTVWKSASCGCCGDWVNHMKEAGFQLKVIETDDVEHYKDMYLVPVRLRSCHTARIGDYIVEGHVPAKDVKTLLNKKPAIIGISVPGMPVGSPGMEMGDRRDPFPVIGFDAKGTFSLWQSYPEGYR